jgi:ribonucleoside-triphosphate reductase
MGCRTRVMGNVHDRTREIASRRGNLSFTSVNLPRIAIKAKGDVTWFFEELERMLNLVAAQLMERFEIVAAKKVHNFPFLMGEGVWLDSEKLGWNDSIREVLKHGTLSIGFIGLAETLVALRGAHHGENPASQNLGLEIVGFIRKFCDDMSEKTQMNFTCLATPAEGLSGRFVRIDRERYGAIKGITDRDYYTNSFHIPVYFNIGAFEKISLEAPYHALTNAGHISYVEMDGDPLKNLDAFEKIVRHMHDTGVGYGSINHPVDRDPLCGFNGVINDVCPGCGRAEDGQTFERIRRITGYLVGTLSRFNNAKQAEERDRVKHEI